MSENPANLHLEIAHILFVDVVGYSKLLVNEQSEAIQTLNEIVLQTEQVRNAEAAHQLIRLATGDGMALVFRNHPETPAECALEIAKALKAQPQVQVRMGVHSGPVNEITDVNQRANIAGAGMNIAQRVMDCGDAGHILLSKRSADDLAQFREWQPLLHDLGEIEVKHGVRLPLVNLYREDAGNPAVPEKLRQGTRRTRRRRFALAAALALLLALGVSVSLWFSSSRQKEEAAPSVPSKSIAVLPLENFSEDKADSFFADGIQDDVLTSLAKIKDLKVISRTSVMSYRDKATRNLKQIGKELGVANVLEGSVRRVKDRVLVNVQLIDTSTDQHIWAERYDRTLADSITLQGELASEIAKALQATLTPEERSHLEQPPTANPDAYTLYLKGLYFSRLPTTEDRRTSVRLLEEATALDPNFALAWGLLAVSRSGLYQHERTEESRAATLSAAQTAMRLRPDQPEGHRALGAYHFINHDLTAAQEECRRVLETLPNDANATSNIALIDSHNGKWPEARAAAERAAALSPQEPLRWYNLSIIASNQRDWAAAARAQDRALTLAPNVPTYQIDRAKTEFYWKGDLAPLKAVLAGFSPEVGRTSAVATWRWQVAMYERDYEAAEAIVISLARDSPTPYDPKTPRLGKIYWARNAPGDAARAKECFEGGRVEYELAVSKSPMEGALHAELGLVYAGLGWRDAAVGEAQYAMALSPESKDATEGTIVAAQAARIFALLGESDLAVPLLEHLLAVPTFEISIQRLRLDPEWDLIRSDPRFAAIGERAGVPFPPPPQRGPN